MNLLSIFSRPKPVVTVQTFKVTKTDLERLRDAKHRQLAAELGRQWPPADMPRSEVERNEQVW